MNRKSKTQLVLALTGILLLGSGITVYADEINPAGYHIYEVQEDEATDTWYGTARGRYLRAGISKVKEGKSGYVIGSGTTLAHYDCDQVYVRIYLDKSDNGTGGWGTLDYWTGYGYEDSVATVGSGEYKITKGKYYRVTGVHSVFEGDVVETTGTCTDAIKL